MRTQKTHPDFPNHLTYEPTYRISGTHLQGTVRASYKELCETFGEPEQGDGEKTRAEWAFRFYDPHEDRYVVATIYDWKRYDVPLDEVAVWNVGGFKHYAVDMVSMAIEEYEERNVPLEPPYEVLIWPDTPEKRYADSVGLPLRWPG